MPRVAGAGLEAIECDSLLMVEKALLQLFRPYGQLIFGYLTFVARVAGNATDKPTHEMGVRFAVGGAPERESSVAQ